MHGGLSDDDSAGFFPLFHAPGSTFKVAFEIQLGPERPTVSLDVHLIFDCHRNSIQGTQGLAIFVSFRRCLRSGTDSIYLGF